VKKKRSPPQTPDIGRWSGDKGIKWRKEQNDEAVL